MRNRLRVFLAILLSMVFAIWLVACSVDDKAPSPAGVTGWGTAELIETDNGYDNSPHVAVDTSGNAVAVWIRSDGRYNNIWANCYVAL